MKKQHITKHKWKEEKSENTFKIKLTLLGSLLGRPSPLFAASGLLSTPTGTITLGGVAVAPSAATCWCGGMVEQYSIGLAGLGLIAL